MVFDVISLLHYYSIGLAFVFGAFIEEWVSGRFLIKEPKGTKWVWNKSRYLSKTTAITIRVSEVLAIPLISIPLAYFLLWIFLLSDFYIVVISIAIINTIYLGTLLELPYKINKGEWFIIIIVYFICISTTLITMWSLGKIT